MEVPQEVFDDPEFQKTYLRYKKIYKRVLIGGMFLVFVIEPITLAVLYKLKIIT